MKTPAFLMMLLLSSGLIFSCGLVQKRKSDDVPALSQSATSTTPVVEENADGTWKTGCVDDDTDNTSSSTDMVISGANITVNVKNYSDKACVTESDTWAGNASFTLGESVTSVTGAKKINITSSKYTVTLKADSTVTIYNSFNTTGVCGGGGWVKNTAKELNATVCANDTTFKTMFNESYGIIKIDGTKLNFGQCGDDGSATSCEADDKRPTSLESATYTKS